MMSRLQAANFLGDPQSEPLSKMATMVWRAWQSKAQAQIRRSLGWCQFSLGDPADDAEDRIALHLALAESQQENMCPSDAAASRKRKAAAM